MKTVEEDWVCAKDSRFTTDHKWILFEIFKFYLFCVSEFPVMLFKFGLNFMSWHQVSFRKHTQFSRTVDQLWMRTPCSCHFCVFILPSMGCCCGWMGFCPPIGSGGIVNSNAINWNTIREKDGVKWERERGKKTVASIKGSRFVANLFQLRSVDFYLMMVT